MRGRDDRDEGLFSYLRLEERVPTDHPLRAIRALTDEALAALNGRLAARYSQLGRPSIPPEHLLRATLLQAFFSVRVTPEACLRHDTDADGADRLQPLVPLVCQAADGFAGLASDGVHQEPRPIAGGRCGAGVTRCAEKSFRPKDGSGEPPAPGKNGERNFRREKRSNATHASTTDPDARLYRKGDGQSSRLCFMGHALMENRNGLVVDATLTHATGTAAREATLTMLDRRMRRTRITLGADKAYDVTDFVGGLRARKVTPHIAVNGAISKTGKRRKTAIDGRTTRHPGYAVSQPIRKRVEEVFGWIKAQAGYEQLKVRGREKAEAVFTFATAAYNLIRIPRLLEGAVT